MAKQLIDIKIKKLRPNTKLPTAGSPDSAGYDVYACLDFPVISIPPHETKLIPLGFSASFDPNYVALEYARSGLATKSGLAPANKVGVVDADYRGEWFMPLHNHGEVTQVVEDGERIAQVIFHPIVHPVFHEVEELDETVRGEGGFGSTGTK